MVQKKDLDVPAGVDRKDWRVMFAVAKEFVEEINENELKLFVWYVTNSFSYVIKTFQGYLVRVFRSQIFKFCPFMRIKFIIRTKERGVTIIPLVAGHD